MVKNSSLSKALRPLIEIPCNPYPTPFKGVLTMAHETFLRTAHELVRGLQIAAEALFSGGVTEFIDREL